MKVAILVACRNRCATTLRFLSSVYSEVLPAGTKVEITLFDDGSTDGTRDAVLESFPAVSVMSGDGSAYWNGAMSQLMEAATSQLDIDALVLANDDVELGRGALGEALALYSEMNGSGMPAAIIGAFEDNNQTTYSGLRRIAGRGPGSLSLVDPTGAPEACDTFNGNFAIVPPASCRQIGGMDRAFIHSGGDIDLGYRLKKAGVRLVVAPHYVGKCERGPSLALRAKHLRPTERIRMVFSPYRSPHDIVRLALKHSGILAPLVILKYIYSMIRIVAFGR